MAITLPANSNQEYRFSRGSTDCLVSSQSEPGQWVIPDLAPTWDNFLREAAQPLASFSIPSFTAPPAAKLSASVVASSILLLCGNTHATRIKNPEEVYVEIIQSRQSLTADREEVAERSAVGKILFVKHLFALTGEKLAAAMLVSRSTIYNWIDASHAMKSDNERRLEKLYTLSELWECQLGKPLGRINGLSRDLKDQFYTALSREDLDDAEVVIQTMKKAEAARPTRKTVLDFISEGRLEPLPKEVSEAALRSQIPSASLWPEPD